MSLFVSGQNADSGNETGSASVFSKEAVPFLARKCLMFSNPQEVIMKARAFVASAIVILLLSGEALALKEHVRVTPKNQESHGFSVATGQRKDGAVQFVITRDLSKARSFAPDSGLEVRRSATLKVSGDSGLIVECQVEADKKKETVVYRFTIARDRIAHAHFTVAEIDDYKNTEGREHYLGGGTFYEFHLADFSEK